EDRVPRLGRHGLLRDQEVEERLDRAFLGLGLEAETHETAAREGQEIHPLESRKIAARRKDPAGFSARRPDGSEEGAARSRGRGSSPSPWRGSRAPRGSR